MEVGETERQGKFGRLNLWSFHYQNTLWSVQSATET